MARRGARCGSALLLLVVVAQKVVAQKVEWVQTARFKDDTINLLQDMPPVEMEPIASLDEFTTSEDPAHALIIDTTVTYQEILGFGGAFTEATAINWRKLSPEDQAEVIRLYFSSPEEGGLGYTLGRVPMNSCDFSPASYSFDDVPGDVTLAHFDMDVRHDVESGIIPMIQQAQALVAKRGLKLNVFASPWSMPAWMKEPVWVKPDYAKGEKLPYKQSMVMSASPNGLMPSMQGAWAKYFSKFISAYRKHGIHLWGVTVQNEPEAAVGWEACLWTPEYMAAFVRDYLGPTLLADHPEVKILGFDHNKDNVAIWAQGLYADPEAAQWFYGIGVHWYGGLNAENLNFTHHLDPSKVILATEACNCGGVVFKNATFASGNVTFDYFLPAWWSRAEALGLDILVDLQNWAVGWTDWNLALAIDGGPNHLKNLCDANIIVDDGKVIGHDSPIIQQASFYYLGHFSRYLPPGSRRVSLTNTVESTSPPLQPGDVKNGQALLFAPCDDNDAQKWVFEHTQLRVRGTEDAENSDGFGFEGECMDYSSGSWNTGGTLMTWRCATDPSAKIPVRTQLDEKAFTINDVPGGSQIKNTASGKCVTTVPTTGDAVGLDRGLMVVAAQLKPCLPEGAPTQTFHMANADQQGFPSNFPVRTLSSAPGGGELCLQPQIARTPHFSAVGFEAPDGTLSVVVMNVGDHTIEFTLVDKTAGKGARGMSIPSHAIHTYRWPSASKPGKVKGGKGGKGATADTTAEPALVGVTNLAAAASHTTSRTTSHATSAASSAAGEVTTLGSDRSSSEASAADEEEEGWGVGMFAGMIAVVVGGAALATRAMGGHSVFGTGRAVEFAPIETETASSYHELS